MLEKLFTLKLTFLWLLHCAQAIEQQKVLHATSEEARRGLEERLLELQQLHAALQKEHAAASEEIAHRGDVTARLEDKLQKCIEKINQKNEVLRKQVSPLHCIISEM